MMNHVSIADCGLPNAGLKDETTYSVPHSQCLRRAVNDRALPNSLDPQSALHRSAIKGDLHGI
jgi:hypothetical protein